MSNIESLQGPIAEIFGLHLNELTASQNQKVRDLAVSVRDRLISGIKQDLILVPNLPQYNIPTITGFALADVSTGNLPLSSPVIVVDQNRLMMNADKTAVLSDLIRTLKIADQFPDKGFERRLKLVCSDALDMEKSWLEEQNAHEVTFDPRYVPKDDLLKTLLREAAYYTDPGFSDFQKAVDILLKDEVIEERVSLLKSVREDKNHFIVGRAKFSPMAHSIATKSIREKYFSMSDDKRSEAAAMMIAALIYTRPEERKFHKR